MKLKNLFRPKWQHDSVEIRRAALAKMQGEERERVLAHFADQDQDEKLRADALRELNDLERYLAAAVDTNKTVANAGRQGLMALLQDHGTSVIERKALLKRCPESIRLAVLESRTESELEATALAGLSEAQIAQWLPVLTDAELRKQHLLNINDEALLEKLSKHRNCAAIAKQQLQELQLERGDVDVVTNAATDLCKQLELLSQKRELRPLKAQRKSIAMQWRRLPQVMPEALIERFARATRVFDKLEKEQDPATIASRAQALADAKETGEQLCVQFETLLQQTPVQNPGGELANHCQQAAQLIQTSWSERPALPAEISEAQELRFAAAQQTFQTRVGAWQQQQQQQQRLQSTVADIEAFADKAGASDEAQLKKLKKTWESLAQTADDKLKNKVNKLLERSANKIKAATEQAQAALPQIPEQLNALEAQLEADELAGAKAAYYELQKALKLVHGLAPNGDYAGWQRRMKNMFPRIKELRDWEQWSGAEERKRLCNEAEALVTDQQTDMAALADQVEILRRLQREWRKLGRPQGAEAEQLSSRFDIAIKALRSRCEPWFAEQRKISDKELAEVSTVADKLQQLAATPSSEMDWKQLANQVRDAKRALANVGKLAGKNRGTAAKMLREALGPAEQVLQEQQNRYAGQKQQLIERAQALLDQPSMDGVIDQAKALQQEWQKSGHADRRTEQALWKDFRAVLDGVFARRDTERNRERNEQKEELSRRAALLDQLAELAEQDSAEAKSAFVKLAAELQALEAIRGKAGDNQQRRLEKLQQQQQKLQQNKQRQAELAVVRLQQQLAARLDAIEAGEEDGAWADDLKALPAALQSPLQTRADRDNNTQTQQQQAELALPLMLKLELAAAVDSPAELKQQRMAMQVEQLNQALGGSNADTPESLQQAWFAIGPLSAADRAAFAQRAKPALAALNPELAEQPQEPKAAVAQAPVVPESIELEVTAAVVEAVAARDAIAATENAEPAADPQADSDDSHKTAVNAGEIKAGNESVMGPEIATETVPEISSEKASY